METTNGVTDIIDFVSVVVDMYYEKKEITKEEAIELIINGNSELKNYLIHAIEISDTIETIKEGSRRGWLLTNLEKSRFDENKMRTLLENKYELDLENQDDLFKNWLKASNSNNLVEKHIIEYFYYYKSRVCSYYYIPPYLLSHIKQQNIMINIDHLLSPKSLIELPDKVTIELLESYAQQQSWFMVKAMIQILGLENFFPSPIYAIVYYSNTIKPKQYQKLLQFESNLNKNALKQFAENNGKTLPPPK